MRRIIVGLLIATACLGLRADDGAAEMVVTNVTTILDVPVVTNLVTITTTNVITEVVTNAVPSPEEIAIENARIEEAERKRRIYINGSKAKILGGIGASETIIDVTDIKCSAGDLASFDIDPMFARGFEIEFR